MLNTWFEEIDPSDRAISAWRHVGKGKATPENHIVLRFHTASAGKRLSMSVAVRLANWAVLPEWRILNSCAGVVLTQRDAQAMARPRRNSAAFVADRVEGDVASGHSLSSLAQVCVIATKDFPIAIRRTGSDANRILGCAKRFESHGYAL